MSDVYAERLNAKVRAVNKANEYANELYKKLAGVFEAFVGEPILKNDGSIKAKYLSRMAPGTLDFPSDWKLHVYRHSSDYNLAWTVKTCESVEGTHTCTYHEVTVYIGNLKGPVLTEICKREDYRSDFTAEEVRQKREAYKKAEQAMRDARSALHPFGEYDH